MVLNNVNDSRISPETIQRVLHAARELGYIPAAAARDQSSRATRAVGLFLPRLAVAQACDSTLSQTLSGLLEVLHGSRLRLIVNMQNMHPNLDDPLELVHSGQIEGLVLANPRFDDPLLARLKEVNFPTVLLGSLPGSDFPSVAIDDARATQAVITHLAGLGYTRIACITCPPLDYPAVAGRLLGYRRALEASGLPYREELVRVGSLSPETGYAQAGRLLELPEPPAAIFATSDIIALGALSAIQASSRRVPQDIALAGFDDLPLAGYAIPPLTSVRVPAAEQARLAARMLVQLIAGEELPQRHLLLEASLVVRDSTIGSRR